MANLFAGFNKATNEDIITQIALLRTMNMSNIMTPYGQKAAKGIVRTVNTVSNYFNKKQVLDEPEVKNINERLEQEVHKLKYYSREDLNKLLRTELVKRVSLTDKNCSDENLSLAIIEEASKLKDLNIDESLSPEQKADSIYRRFAERMLSKIKKELNAENTVQAQQTTAELEKNLNQLPQEKREELKKILQVDELTGKTVRSALITMKTPALLLGASTIGGFGSFIALSTIMHAVFTTTLGITLPFAAYTTASSALSVLTGPIGWSAVLGLGAWQIHKGSTSINREMLAQSVFFAITAYGRQLAPLNEDLPSWVPTENIVEREKIKQNDLEIQRLIREKNAAVFKYEEQTQRVYDLLNKLNTSQFSLKQAQEAQAKAKAKMDFAKQQEAEYSSKIKDLERKLADNQKDQNTSQQTILKLTNALHQLETKLAGNKLDFQNYQDHLEELQNKERAYTRQIEALNEQKAKLDAENARLNAIKDDQEVKLRYSQQQTEDFQKIAQEKVDAELKIKQQRLDLNKLFHQLNSAETELQEAQKEKIRIQNMMSFAQEQKHDFARQIDELKQELNDNALTKKHNQQRINELAKELAQAQNELKSNQQDLKGYEKLFNDYAQNESDLHRQLDELKEEHQRLIIENTRLEQEKTVQEAILDTKRGKIAQDIEAQWDIFFPKLDYSFKFLKNLTNYGYDIRLELEKVLLQLERIDDPRKLSIGKLNNSDDIDHSKVQGNNYRICWRLTKQRHIELLKFGTHAEINRYYKNFDK